MSLSVDTEAETQHFTSEEEQFMSPECLTPSKLSAWLMRDSKSECLWNVCVIHQKQFPQASNTLWSSFKPTAKYNPYSNPIPFNPKPCKLNF